MSVLAQVPGPNVVHAMERHYKVGEIAAIWNISGDVVRQLFEREPGVLVLGNQFSTRGKRRYRTIRVPESVVARVHKRLLKV